jgi:hypothetical protein
MKLLQPLDLRSSCHGKTCNSLKTFIGQTRSGIGRLPICFGVFCRLCPRRSTSLLERTGWPTHKIPCLLTPGYAHALLLPFTSPPHTEFSAKKKTVVLRVSSKKTPLCRRLTPWKTFRRCCLGLDIEPGSARYGSTRY